MKRVLCFIMFIATIFLFGCSKQISELAYQDLLKNLENMNYSVSEKDVEKEILQGQRKFLTINNKDHISIYLYESNERMEEDATFINVGGTEYRNGKDAVDIEWVSYPHFFKSDNMIVLYVGEDSEMIRALKELVGPEFAGAGLY